MMASPRDPGVRDAEKRATTWIGTEVHLTETCGAGQPSLTTRVETTTAPVVDRDVLADMHAASKDEGIRPERRLVDAGSVSTRVSVPDPTTFGTHRAAGTGMTRLRPAGSGRPRGAGRKPNLC